MRALHHFAKSVRRWPAAATNVAAAKALLVVGIRRQPLTSIAATTAPRDVVVNEYKNSSKIDEHKLRHDGTTATTTTSSSSTIHVESDTALVDQLLVYTRELMDRAHRNKNDDDDDDDDDAVVMDAPDAAYNTRHIVAFSGGIDSSLVLALLAACRQDTAASNNNNNSINNSTHNESVHAVLGRSPAVPQDQVALARKVAEHIGIPLQEVTTEEGKDQVYIENNGQACLACKTHLYTALQAVAEHALLEDTTLLVAKSSGDEQQRVLQQQHQLYNGTNADDMTDSTRVGLIAAQNFQVQSPLMYTTKADVRRAARHLGLPNWNVAASPCLRSRLALGVEATQDHLTRIEAAERFVREKLKHVISETTNLRVRLMAGNRAMLEIDEELLPHVESSVSVLSSNDNSNYNLDNEETNKQQSNIWNDYFIQTLGFADINARPFRSGSVSKVVK